MHTQAHFWDKRARSYSQKPVPDQEVYEKKLALTRTLLNPEMEVLEIGCGTGTTALFHSPFVKHITATDYSSEMISIAKEKATQKAITNVDFQVESIEAMNYPDKTFDMVMAHSILHLLPDPETTLRTIYDALKPGGHFVSSTVCIKDFSRLMSWILPIGHRIGIFPFVNSFSSEWLLNRLTDTGFAIQQQWKPKSSTIFIIAKKPEA